jgi:hypothetical protein
LCQQILEKNHERKKHMKTITKCIYAEIAVFAFACFAIAQSAQAQRGNGDTRTFVIRFETHVLNCAPEIVQGAGRVRLKFGVNRAFEVVPEQIQLQEVRGKGGSTEREYKPRLTDLRALDLEVSRPQRTGRGAFKISFLMIGRPNPKGTADPNPQKRFDFAVEYRVEYEFTASTHGGHLTDRELNVSGPRTFCCTNCSD